MSKYIMRLDDAAAKRDTKKWDRIENIFDKFNIKPLVGVIPNCQDKAMDIYDTDSCFWSRVHSWIEKGWVIAMHGYNHICDKKSGGINPVNKVSEFAGAPLESQEDKIKKSSEIFKQHSIEPYVFFAPSHTFDDNTIIALKKHSNVKFISDTIACKPYSYNQITIVPQQSGMCRTLPFPIVTFCYHPNTMTEQQFNDL